MKFDRKKGITGVCLSLILVTMSGCGNKNSDTFLDVNNPTNIVIWNYYTGAQLDAFDACVEEFNETRGKEIGVVVSSFSQGSVNDLEEHIFAAVEKKARAEELPTLFSAYTDTVSKLDKMGLIADLDPYFDEEERAEYVTSYLDEGILEEDGGLKIFPIAKATEVLFLNKTDWNIFADETGVSLEQLQTIEGLTEIAKLYYEWTDAKTEEPDDGKAFFGRDSKANYFSVGGSQLGHPMFTRDQDGNLQFDSDQETMKKLWDNYYVPYIHGYFAEAGRFRSDDVKTGTILAFVGSSAGATFFPSEVIVSDDESYLIDSEIYPAPIFENGENYVIQQGAGMAVISESDAKIEASMEFLKWFTDVERNIQFSVESGYLPVKKAANDMNEIEKDVTKKKSVTKCIRVAVDTINNGKAQYSVPMENGLEIRDILEYGLTDLAKQDLQSISEAMEAGSTKEEAIAVFDTEEHFLEWYDMTCEKIRSVL